MAALSQLLFQKVQKQTTSHVRKEGAFIVFDEGVLPDMELTPDWQKSATRQWNMEELTWLQTTPAEEIAADLNQTRDPWIHMAAVAEIVMHGQDDRARQLIQTLLILQPEAEGPLAGYLGAEIMEVLQTSTGS